MQVEELTAKCVNEVLEAEFSAQLDQKLLLATNHIEANALLAKEIADRKQAEESLQENKDRLTQIIHGNSIPTFVIDQNHRITHWNKALERLTGISSAEAVGTNEQWKAFYAYKRPTMADLILDQVKEEKIKEFYANKYTQSKLLEESYEVEDFFELNGKNTWLFFTAAPIKSRSGVLIGAVETLQDISNRKILEQEILRQQAILENKVEERTLQLKKTYEQLVHAEKLSAIGKLAASIAHEFGNPIIGIRNFLKEIQKTTHFDKDDAELLQLAIQECQRVKDLISNLQNFNRPSSGNMAMMDLHLAINDMLLFCKKSFRENRIIVKKRFDPQLPMILGVHDQIKQVILNCLNNAQEAIPDHGGTIQIITEHTEQTVLLHIRDTGKGIVDSDVVYIFEPFFSTKPAVEGTGLGLSVSYGIMKAHQGSITVSDTSSHGTTFTLSFPIAKTLLND
ncbi:MAG: ATP-binding protein [Desulfobulbaceae bacterium]|nr:ATP-binding protein [Desulfobulbaceae bacterium]